METSSKLNFTYPSYYTFVHHVLGTFYQHWNELDHSHKLPTGWVNVVQKYAGVQLLDIVYVLVLAVFWTLLRLSLTSCLFQPAINHAGLGKLETKKAPESIWKLLFYSCTWSYSIYLLFFTKHNFFFDVPSIFLDWKILSVVPLEIYTAYLIQISFYLHSVYATLYVDVWRRDSIVMLAHHFVTMLLIGFSYAFRYTNVGILILFLHDITDIILEGTKLLVYFKTKGGRWQSICDFLSTIGFVSFGIAWFLFRLYWFPLKAIYASGYISQKINPDLVCYHFFNGLLLILLGMNIYWFMFIVNMAVKILTGNATEVKDIRDEGEETNDKKIN